MAKEHGPYYCGHCVWGDHRICVGDCACADAAHNPDDPLATRMGVTARPDMAEFARMQPARMAELWRNRYALVPAEATDA